MTEVINRLRKLREHAESARAIGNDAEALAYLDKVRDLMDAKGLTEDDIRSADTPADELTTAHAAAFGVLRERRAPPDDWEIMLGNAVASLHGVVALFYGTRSSPMFFGRRQQIEAACLAYLRLHRYAYDTARHRTAEYQKHLRATAGHGNTMGFRMSWLDGFAAMVRERVDDPSRARGTAIVSRAVAEAQEALDARKVATKERRKAPGIINPHGFADGVNHAKGKALDGKDMTIGGGA